MYIPIGSQKHSWCVLHTKPGKENIVAHQLAQQDILHYLPKIKKAFRVGMRVRPLFPSYLFLHICPRYNYHKLKWMPGVNRFVGSRDFLATLSEQQIDAIRARESPNGLIEYIQKPKSPFRKKERVRVVQGIFCGFDGLFERYLPGKDRVKILLNVLKYQSSVEIEAAYVATIEESALF